MKRIDRTVQDRQKRSQGWGHTDTKLYYDDFKFKIWFGNKQRRFNIKPKKYDIKNDIEYIGPT